VCGIIGQLSYRNAIEKQSFISMLDTLSHRGPDGCGTVFLDKDRIGLGHYRLSIIDLTEAGSQPMSNEDDTIWLVFNGEIYNYPVLRRTLIGTGHIFRSHADSEVIIHAYEEWGDDCVMHLRGIFAFGLWDGKARRLMLARDHLGVKPVYYTSNNHKFTFASQPRALIHDPDAKRRVDIDAFSDYLSYGYVPLDKAIFQGMAKLPAAHRLIVEGGRVRVERYWQIRYVPVIGSEQDAIHMLRDALQEAVQLQMISDVPVGSFLSGGIDSSLITALMNNGTTNALQTFTVGFDEAQSDEREYARAVSSRFGTNHHEDVMTEAIAYELIPAFTEIYDEPFFDSSGLPTHYVSKLARSHGIKVILSGDGGDEVFAGYRWYDYFYRTMAGNRRLGFKKWIDRCRIGYVGNKDRHSMQATLEAYFGWVGFLSREKQKCMLTSSAIDEAGSDHLWLLRSFYQPDYPTVTMAQQLDMNTYLVDDILTKVDRASMACGLEVRVPLLDYKLVEHAFTIDAKLVYRNRMRKYIFKKAIAKWIPNEILTARKKGFSIPLKQWMDRYLHGLTCQVLEDGSLVNQGILIPHIAKMIDLKYNPNITWLLFVAELWARRWIEGCSSEDIKRLFISYSSAGMQRK
jgi:asparagine synthase (glutamine-hydrolysing)